MKKVVLKLDLHDDKSKKKAMKAVSSITGVESIAIDMKESKLTVIGDVDPVNIVSKLRKGNWHTDIITVGPAKEEKKDDGKKDEAKKDEGKKDEGKKDEGKKEDNKKKEEQQIAELVKAYKAYNPYLTQHYHVVSYEENPNACVIC